MARMSNNWTRVPILAAVLFIVALISMTEIVGATSDDHSPKNHSRYDHDHSPKDHDHSLKNHSRYDHDHSHEDHDHSPKDHDHSPKDHDHSPKDHDHSPEDRLREDRLPRVLSWRKFKIDNIFPVSGTPDCPDANPNTVTFHPSRRDRYKGNVTIEGNFDAANIGVCTTPPGNQYAVSPNTTIHYHIYGDLVLWLITGRTTYASQFVFQQGNLSAIGLANEGTYYVSTLTDIGFGNHTH